MKVELTVPKVRALVGEVAWILYKNTSRWVKETIHEVVRRNICTDNDWIHFSNILEIRTDDPHSVEDGDDNIRI